MFSFVSSFSWVALCSLSLGIPAPSRFHTSYILWTTIKATLTLKRDRENAPTPTYSHLKYKAGNTPVRLYVRCNLGVTFFRRHTELGCRTSHCRSASATHSFTRELQSGLASSVTVGFEDSGFELCVSSIPYAKLNLNLRQTHERVAYLQPSHFMSFIHADYFYVRLCIQDYFTFLFM